MPRKKAVHGDHNQYANVPVMNASQLGGIETSVLDNGPGRGVRIAWVNTGGGLRYKVVIDRGLDILDADYRGQNLTWHSAAGVVAPNWAYSRGVDFLRDFFGGLLTCCGPINAGMPFMENGVEYGLHGTHTHTPAVIESIVNPDLASGQLEMSLTASIRTARLFGPNVELRRRISSTLGESSIRIHDRFTNRDNQSTPHAWVLHINFGYPLLEPGASVFCFKGKVTPRADSVAWYTQRKDFRRACQPLDAHRGGGEVFTYIDPSADRQGRVYTGVVNTKRSLAVRIDFNKQQFPRLGNWQHWGPAGSYAGAMEPMTGGVEGRPVDDQRGWTRHLEPGESAEYEYTITATDDPQAIKTLLGLNG